jgi:hypothetical protein
MSESYINQGSGYFFHGKMPGCGLPRPTAASALHLTAGDLKRSLQQEPTPCFAFSAAIALCPLEAPGRSSCREKKHPDPPFNYKKFWPYSILN